MTDYKLSDEYRERFSFNQGERYWIEQAFELYVKTAYEQIDAETSIISPGYIKQLFKDIDSKLDCWTD